MKDVSLKKGQVTSTGAVEYHEWGGFTFNYSPKEQHEIRTWIENNPCD